MSKLCVVDVNNFMSATGGGVRRYHLEKLAHFEDSDEVDYHLVVPSDVTKREARGSATVHYVTCPDLFGTGYRPILRPRWLRALLLELRPDVVEVGSPYIAPDLVRWATRGLDCRIVGFWHAHYPIAYARNFFGRFSSAVGGAAEKASWWWARRTYGRFDRTMAAAGCLTGSLREAGIDNVSRTPLGVDLGQFSPSRRDDALREEWGAGPDDVVVAFPHRLCEEKRLDDFLRAYEMVRERTKHRPIVVVAGQGHLRGRVEELARRDERFHYLGYLSGRDEMARVLASSDVVVALSPTETFGLSCAEAMASGAAVIGSEEMAVGEMLRESRGGLTVPDHDADAIARAWARLLTPGLAHRMGTRAYSYALARYSWASSFERITRVYQQVSATEGEPEVYGPMAPIATSGAITGWSAKLTEWEPPAAEGRRRSVRRWRTPRRER